MANEVCVSMLLSFAQKLEETRCQNANRKIKCLSVLRLEIKKRAV